MAPGDRHSDSAPTSRAHRQSGALTLPEIHGNTVDVTSLTPAQNNFIRIWYDGDNERFFNKAEGSTATVGPTEQGVLTRIVLFETLGLREDMTVVEVGASSDWHTAAIATAAGADYHNHHLEHQSNVLDDMFMPDFPA